MISSTVEDGLAIAVLLPCYNQASTVSAVVRGFANALPGARIYVFDNNSTDDTALCASLAGALVLREGRQGKGNVVRRMFADIEADIYVMADGDGSYDPADAPSLVNALITEHADMAVGTRRGERTDSLDRLYGWAFGEAVTDVVSGYRAFTRRFVKSFPAIPTGFPIETEMSVHASQLMIPVTEIDLARDPGSARRPGPSALGRSMSSVAMMVRLARETRPFAFFAALAVLAWAVGLVILAPDMSGVVGGEARANSAATAIGLGLFIGGFLLAGSGLILESLNRSRIEQKRILFLAAPALGAH